MDMRTPRDRIWYHMHNTERMSRYYARRSRALAKRHKIYTFLVAAIPVVAIATLGFNWEYKEWLASGILLVAALIEVAVIHFGVGSDVKAARIMGLQAGKLSEQWRKLWLDQERADVLSWIEFLEDQTKHVGIESIPYDNKLSAQCHREVIREFATQFGG